MITTLRHFISQDNDRLAAYARPHDPADYERPELDGEEMVWRYGPTRNRLRRLTAPPLDHPATRLACDRSLQGD